MVTLVPSDMHEKVIMIVPLKRVNHSQLLTAIFMLNWRLFRLPTTVIFLGHSSFDTLGYSEKNSRRIHFRKFIFSNYYFSHNAEKNIFFIFYEIPFGFLSSDFVLALWRHPYLLRRVGFSGYERKRGDWSSTSWSISTWAHITYDINCWL